MERFAESGGLIKKVVVAKDGFEVIISGWAKMAPFLNKPETKLIVRAELPVEKAACAVDVRPDVYTPIRGERLIISGFAITMTLSSEIKGPLDLGSIDVYCEDRTFGNTLINKAHGLQFFVN